jgi:hypothetical protein
LRDQNNRNLDRLAIAKSGDSRDDNIGMSAKRSAIFFVKKQKCQTARCAHHNRSQSSEPPLGFPPTVRWRYFRRCVGRRISWRRNRRAVLTLIFFAKSAIVACQRCFLEIMLLTFLHRRSASRLVQYDINHSLCDLCHEKYSKRQSSIGRSPAEQ